MEQSEEALTFANTESPLDKTGLTVPSISPLNEAEAKCGG